MTVTHYPESITNTTVGVNGPKGEYIQLDIAVSLCKGCSKIHAATSDPGIYGMAPFWLGVKYAQLNKWTELDLVEVAGATFEGQDNEPG